MIIRTKKKKLRKLNLLLKDAQEIFNKWVRVRDSENPCISCGQHKENYHAGHYVPQGASSFLRFHPDNVNKECAYCNYADKFHLVGYRKNLINKIGIERVEFLEENRRLVKRWTREELEAIIQKYKYTRFTDTRNDDKNEAMEYLYQHIKPDPEHCEVFGCGKELSIKEKLFGKKCIHCQEKENHKI